MRAKGVIDGRKETWTVPDDEDCVGHFRGLSQLPTMFCILNSEHFMSKPSFCTIHTYLWDARGERTPGNSRKALIPKIRFLSRRLCTKFVRMGPGLPFDFKNLSGHPD